MNRPQSPLLLLGEAPVQATLIGPDGAGSLRSLRQLAHLRRAMSVATRRSNALARGPVAIAASDASTASSLRPRSARCTLSRAS